MQPQQIQNPEFYITDNGFVCEDKTYNFSEILHLSFRRIRINGYPTVHLTIDLVDTGKIELFEKHSSVYIGLDMREIEKRVEDITDTYVILANETSSNRAQFYIKQIQESGYFFYEGFQFIPGEKITKNKRVFQINEVEFLKDDRWGVIMIRPKKYSLMDRLLDQITGRNLFSTQVDTDVLFFLLEKYFGLQLKT